MKSANKNSFATLLLTACAALAFLGSTAATHAGVYIKFEGVDGESLDTGHEGWIPILSFSQGMSRTESSDPDSDPRLPGTPKFDPITCTKKLDRSSPKLMAMTGRGRLIPTVVVDFTKANPKGLGSVTYMRIELVNVRIGHLRLAGKNSADTVPVENFSLNFEQIKATYFEDDPDRKNGEFEWKVEEGT
jgi:type VI secretion system secreted protein Hcp